MFGRRALLEAQKTRRVFVCAFLECLCVFFTKILHTYPTEAQALISYLVAIQIYIIHCTFYAYSNNIVLS